MSHLQKDPGIEPLLHFEGGTPLAHLEAHVRGISEMIATIAGIYGKSARQALGCLNENEDPFSGIEAQYVTKAARLACEGYNWRIEVDNQARPHQLGDRYFYISNHPSTVGLWVVLSEVAERFAKNQAFVMKEQFLYYPYAPLIGWPIYLMGHGIFVDRVDPKSPFAFLQSLVPRALRESTEEKRLRALDSIRGGLNTNFKPGTGMWIFPDQHRVNSPRIYNDCLAFEQVDPTVWSWLNHTCFPRRGGLDEMLVAAEDLTDLRCLNITVIEVPDVDSGLIRILIEDADPTEIRGKPGSAQNTGQWLIDAWKRKNQKIEAARSQTL